MIELIDQITEDVRKSIYYLPSIKSMLIVTVRQLSSMIGKLTQLNGEVIRNQ